MKATVRSLLFLFALSILALRAGAQVDLSPQLETIRAKYNLPGLTAMVIKSDKILAKGQTGVREEGQGALLTTDDALNIGSCSKSMTAAIAGRLVDKGLIKWTTRVRDLFPEYTTFTSGFWDVTLEQLLAHRGGVESGAVWEPAHFDALSHQTGTIQQIRRWAVQQALTDPAGPIGQYIYSNQGYTTAGTMLELASGKTWETLVQEEVFTPLGMTTSRVGCSYDGTVPPPAPVGHIQSAPKATPQPFQPYSATFLAQYQAATAPAGFVVTPMREWAHFLDVFLGHAPGYLQPATLKKIETPQGTQEYGLGIFAVLRSWAGGVAFSHEGELFQESSMFWLAPAKDFMVLAFSNCRVVDTSDPSATDTVTEALNDVCSAYISKYVAAAAAGPVLDPISSFHLEGTELSVTPDAHTVSLTVRRTWPGDSTATVGYTLTEETAGVPPDFTGPASGTLNFRAGQAAAELSIPLAPRSQPAGSHTFQVQLTSASAPDTIGSPGALTVEVHDVPVVTAGAASPSVGGAAAGGGTPAPGAGSVSGPPAGAILTAFGVPALDDAGAMASRTTLKAGHATLAGLYHLNAQGAATLPAWQGSPAPDLPGALFRSFSDPVLAPGGALAFLARVEGGGVHAGVSDSGLWTDAFGTLRLVLRAGQPVPGLPAGTLLKAVQSISLENGELAALVQFSPAHGIVTAANDVALLRITGLQTVAVALRKGDALEGSVVHSFSTFVPAASSPGQGRWHTPGRLTAVAVLASRKTVLVQMTPGATPSVRLLSGDTAAPSATVAAMGLPDAAVGALAIAATLHAAPGQTDAAHGPALLAGADNAALSLLAGSSAAGADFTAISDPAINSSGSLAFLGTLKSTALGSPATISSGLFTGSLTAAPALSAGPGQSAPGRAEDTSEPVVWSSIGSFIVPDGNTAGPVILAKLKGHGVTAANNTGLWALAPSGPWQLLLRTGEQVELASGPRTVSSFALFNALPGSPGTRRSYNATKQIALLAKFTDRSQALLRLNLP